MKVESRVTVIACAVVSGSPRQHRQVLGDLEAAAAQRLRILADVHREQLPEQGSSRSIGHQGGEMGPQMIQRRGRSAMRWPADASLDLAAGGAMNGKRP